MGSTKSKNIIKLHNRNPNRYCNHNHYCNPNRNHYCNPNRNHYCNRYRYCCKTWKRRSAFQRLSHCYWLNVCQDMSDGKLPYQTTDVEVFDDLVCVFIYYVYQSYKPPALEDQQQLGG